MESRDLEGAVQRLLGPNRSCPETPPKKLFGEVKADSHPQDDETTEKSSVPSRQLLRDLEEITLEAGPSLEILKEQAKGSQINGAVLEALEVQRLRLDAIKWLSSQFVAFGFRDEWLADAILYMDRLAVQMHRSENFHALGLEVSEVEVKAAVEAMGRRDIWLAAVMMALKMSEAESELDTSIQDLVIPLVPFDANGLKCNRQTWEKIKATEFFVMRELDSRLLTSTALHFVQQIARELLVEPSALPWQGVELVELPRVLGPCLPGHEERRRAVLENAMPGRRLTRLQALAQYLADLATVHKPSHVYGDQLCPAVLAVTVLRLALYGWGSPPAACEARLLKVQEKLGMALEPDQVEQKLLAEVYRLWLRPPPLSPVVSRWQKRDIVMTLAPSQDELPLELQECFFNTPQKMKPEPKDTSATPGVCAQPEALAVQDVEAEALPELESKIVHLPPEPRSTPALCAFKKTMPPLNGIPGLMHGGGKLPQDVFGGLDPIKREIGRTCEPVATQPAPGVAPAVVRRARGPTPPKPKTQAPTQVPKRSWSVDSQNQWKKRKVPNAVKCLQAHNRSPERKPRPVASAQQAVRGGRSRSPKAAAPRRSGRLKSQKAHERFKQAMEGEDVQELDLAYQEVSQCLGETVRNQLVYHRRREELLQPRKPAPGIVACLDARRRGDECWWIEDGQ